LDGLMGLGPTGWTLGLLHPDTDMIARTITDNLFHEHQIKQQVTVSLFPSNSTPVENGELTFGGVDTDRCTGEINYFPLAKSDPANAFWSAESAFYYGEELLFNNAPGVFDTGTVLFGLATDAYNLYVKTTGAVFDEKNTGLLRLTLDQYEKLQSIYIKIEHETYEFNKNAQIWPRALNHLINGKEGFVYSIMSDLGPDLSGDMSFVAGVTFLQRYCLVLDSRRHRIGLGNTRFTNSMDIN